MARKQDRKQIGSALIKNLVVYSVDRVLDMLSCHKASFEISVSGIFESSSNRQRDTLSCRKLLQVVIKMDLQKLAPLRRRHPAEHWMRLPLFCGYRVPIGLEDFE